MWPPATTTPCPTPSPARTRGHDGHAGTGHLDGLPAGAGARVGLPGALGLAQSYQIFGARLEITYDGGVLVYTSLSLPLENTLWKVTLLNGATPA